MLRLTPPIDAQTPCYTPNCTLILCACFLLRHAAAALSAVGVAVVALAAGVGSATLTLIAGISIIVLYVRLCVYGLIYYKAPVDSQTVEDEKCSRRNLLSIVRLKNYISKVLP